VFIKRNSSRQRGKTYTSVLLVEGARVALTRPRGRPGKDSVAKTRVVHRTLANLSRLPEPLIALIERYCRRGREKAKRPKPSGESNPRPGPSPQ
jgi:hypothetical protein